MRNFWEFDGVPCDKYSCNLWVELTDRYRNNIVSQLFDYNPHYHVNLWKSFTNETHWQTDGHSLTNTCPFYAFCGHYTIKSAYENMQECPVLIHQVILLQAIFLFLLQGHWEPIRYSKILFRFTPCSIDDKVQWKTQSIWTQDSWSCKFYVTTYICRWRDSQYHIWATENCSIQSFDHHTIIHVLDMYHWFLQMNSLWKIKAIWFGIADPSGHTV